MDSDWANLFFRYIDDVDLKILLNQAKTLDEKLGTAIQPALKHEFRKWYGGEYDIIGDDIDFNCKEAGFHLWDFKRPDIPVDTYGELEFTLECKLCGTKVTLRGKTEKIQKEGT